MYANFTAKRPASAYDGHDHLAPEGERRTFRCVHATGVRPVSLRVMDFASTCAVVTGGESGIGKACALALGRAHAAVALTWFHDEAAATAVVAEITAAGGKALARAADVGNEADVEALFVAAEKAFGPVRLLVNSAGLNMTGTPFQDMSLAQFDRVLRADLHGPFLTCRQLVRGLDGREGGARIVNISSIH